MKAKSLKIITLSMVILLCFTNLFGCFLFQKQETPNEIISNRLANIVTDSEEYQLVGFSDNGIYAEEVKVYQPIDKQNYIINGESLTIDVINVKLNNDYYIVGDNEYFKIANLKYKNKEIIMWHEYYLKISSKYQEICNIINEVNEQLFTVFVRCRSVFDDTIKYITYDNYLYTYGYYIYDDDFFIITYYYKHGQIFSQQSTRIPYLLFKFDIEEENLIYYGYCNTTNESFKPCIQKKEISNE